MGEGVDPAAQGGFGGLGQSAVITQDATTLTITRTTQMGEVTSVYKLDRSESKNTLNFQGNSIDRIRRRSGMEARCTSIRP